MNVAAILTDSYIVLWRGRIFFQTKFWLDFFFKISTMYLPKKKKKEKNSLDNSRVNNNNIGNTKVIFTYFGNSLHEVFSDHFDGLLCWFKLTFTLMLHSVSLWDSRVYHVAERSQLHDSNGPQIFAKWETLMLRIGLSV